MSQPNGIYKYFRSRNSRYMNIKHHRQFTGPLSETLGNYEFVYGSSVLVFF